MDQLAGREPAVADVMEADRSFHDLVARASENRVVAAVSRDIRELIGTLWGFSALAADQARVVADQHRTIADAIGRRDPDEAAAAMSEHLRWAAQADLHGQAGQPESRVDRLVRSTGAAANTNPRFQAKHTERPH